MPPGFSKLPRPASRTSIDFAPTKGLSSSGLLLTMIKGTGCLRQWINVEQAKREERDRDGLLNGDRKQPDKSDPTAHRCGGLSGGAVEITQFNGREAAPPGVSFGGRWSVCTARPRSRQHQSQRARNREARLHPWRGSLSRTEKLSSWNTSTAASTKGGTCGSIHPDARFPHPRAPAPESSVGLFSARPSSISA